MQKSLDALLANDEMLESAIDSYSCDFTVYTDSETASMYDLLFSTGSSGASMAATYEIETEDSDGESTTAESGFTALAPGSASVDSILRSCISDSSMYWDSRAGHPLSVNYHWDYTDITGSDLRFYSSYTTGVTASSAMTSATFWTDSYTSAYLPGLSGEGMYNSGGKYLISIQGEAVAGVSAATGNYNAYSLIGDSDSGYSLPYPFYNVQYFLNYVKIGEKTALAVYTNPSGLSPSEAGWTYLQTYGTMDLSYRALIDASSVSAGCFSLFYPCSSTSHYVSECEYYYPFQGPWPLVCKSLDLTIDYYPDL